MVVLGPDIHAVSGVSTHVRQLLDSDVGSEFELIHFQTGSEGRDKEGALQKLWRLAAAPLGLARVLLTTGAPLVHINSAMEHKAFWRDLSFVLVARAARRHIVFQVHGGHLPSDFARVVPGGESTLRRALRLPDEIVLLAEAERVAYLAFDGSLSVIVIPNAIEADFLPRSPGSSLVGRRPLELVYVGRLARAKGIFESAYATAAAIGQGIEVRMTYAGAGPDEAELREIISAFRMNDAFRFLGPVFGHDKISLWRESDVFMFPTYHREGLPYSLLEAMATETLVVTTPTGGIPDVVDATQAILVEPCSPQSLVEAIASVDANRDRATRKVRAALTRVEEAYLVERLAVDFVALYSSCTARHA